MSDARATLDGARTDLTTAESVARALDKPMGLLGVVFLFVVLGQTFAIDDEVAVSLTVVGWVFWAVFVGEFLLRGYIARFQRAFWTRNWWQVVFLLVPFLRFFRALHALQVLHLTRMGHVGGVVSASVRGTRSSRALGSRLAWVVAVVAVVVLGTAQLLSVIGYFER